MRKTHERRYGMWTILIGVFALWVAVILALWYGRTLEFEISSDAMKFRTSASN